MALTPEEIKKHNDARLRRAKAWMKRAKQADVSKKKSSTDAVDDSAVCFVFWWIAFEAAFKRGTAQGNGDLFKFINDIGQGGAKKAELEKILKKHKADADKLVSLRYIHAGFWVNHRGHGGYRNAKDWEKKFNDEVKKYKDSNTNILKKLGILFSRLRVARNQIFHGANSRHDSWGIMQTKIGAKLLRDFVPFFIKEIEDNFEHNWEKVPFPHAGKKKNDKNALPPWSTTTT